MISKEEKIHRILKPNAVAKPEIQLHQQRSCLLQIKDFCKSSQLIYHGCMLLFSPLRGDLNYSRRIFRYLKEDPIILNLGSGNKIIHPSIINLDIHPYPQVDIVSTIESLPIQSGSVDGVICEVTFEHLKDPQKAMTEISRVLKPGGILCISLPFLFPYHESPDDYYRWTHSGVTQLLATNDFAVVQRVILGGPTATTALILAQFLATLLSLNIKLLHYCFLYLFLALLSPLKFLDFLLARFSFASHNASLFLFIARNLRNSA